MSKASLCILGLLAALAPLRADWKITTVVTSAGHRSVSTEYFKNASRRYDFDSGAGKQTVSIVDYDKLRQTIWDVDRREYVVMRLRRALTPSAPRVNATARPVLLVEIATTDTGERQTIFGREARHLISSEKRYQESDGGSAPVLESEQLTDGWYVDAPGLPGEKRAGTGYILAAGAERPVIKVKHTGATLTGLAVRERMTSHFVGGRGGSSTHETTFEVTELFEGSLPQKLFEAPRGFQRVTRLPSDYHRNVSDEIEMYWNWFQDWVSGWFS